jgi:hypothetical protein
MTDGVLDKAGALSGFDQLLRSVDCLDQWTVDWHARGIRVLQDVDIGGLVCALHATNNRLWLAENVARRDGIAAAEYVAVKRRVDSYNLERHGWIERLDDCMLTVVRQTTDAPLALDTPGMVVDRLSVLSLRIFFVALECAERAGAGRERLAERLAVLKGQRSDLRSAFAVYIEDIDTGRRRFRLYTEPKLFSPGGREASVGGGTADVP